MQRLYQIGEVAARTGVSIRTLRHYDQIGLLRPSGRTASGYRLYATPDLLRLQQALTLRYLGFALAQIRELLDRADFDVAASLDIQRTVVRDRIAELERVDVALRELLDARRATGRWAWDLVTQASAAVAVGPDEKGMTMSDYYTPDQLKQRFAEVGAQTSPEEIRAVESGWSALLKEVRANSGLDPASPQARELLRRWDELTATTIKGYRDDPKMIATLQRNYNEGVYADNPDAPTQADLAFIASARAAAGK
ncbi:MAG TPA: MerR family transcriptional regulator [Ktedonobacterales bacterium]|nr:MerR family transcriptional regulator [Ktedonobacterales bacterium]